MSTTPAIRATTWDEMVAAYSEQVHGLVTGGVDLLLAETAFDTLNMKACLFAIDEYFQTRRRIKPPGYGLDDHLQRR